MRARHLNEGQAALRNATLRGGGVGGLRPDSDAGRERLPFGRVPPAVAVAPLPTPSGAGPSFAPCIAVARNERQRCSILLKSSATQLPLGAKRPTTAEGRGPVVFLRSLRRAPLASSLDTPPGSGYERLSLRPREKPSQGPAPAGPFLLILDRYR